MSNDMTDITQVARARNTRSRSSAESIWLADHEINTCEFLRVELRRKRERAVVDVRRWRKLPNGTPRSTEKGLAISVRHLSALKGLIDAAAAQTDVDGLLIDDGAARSVSGDASW
jgi:hypothetical protein